MLHMKEMLQTNFLSILRFFAIFIIILSQDVFSQPQKHFTTITDADIVADFNYASARLVSFYADKWNFNYNNSGMTRFSSATDKYKTNIIAPDKVWGNARVLYKIDHGDWIPVYSGETKAELVSANKVVYTDYEKGMPIKMERTLEKIGN